MVNKKGGILIVACVEIQYIQKLKKNTNLLLTLLKLVIGRIKMNKKAEKRSSGYRYFVKDEDWSVETDYFNEIIYLGAPECDGDLSAIKNYGRAIIQAVKDMKKDLKVLGVK